MDEVLVQEVLIIVVEAQAQVIVVEEVQVQEAQVVQVVILQDQEEDSFNKIVSSQIDLILSLKIPNLNFNYKKLCINTHYYLYVFL